MDFRQFRYFIVAAEELHFARAAEKLGIAQPALSQQIKALEDQIGARLFLRERRRVELTAIGAAFLKEARPALEQAERALRLVRDMARGEAGRIDIGAVGSAMYEPRFTRALNAYSQAHPGVRVTLHEMLILAQIDALRARQIDLAVVRDPVPEPLLQGLARFPLSSQRLVAVLPETHPRAGRPAIRLADIRNDAFIAFNEPPGTGIGQTLLDLCESAGFAPKIAQKVSEIATAVGLAAAGFGVALVPETLACLRLPGVRYLPLMAPGAASSLAVIHRRFERAAAVRALLAHILKNRAAAPETVIQ
ncbi:MAG: LysR family transcriptional regulator [Candidatus Accumulibacter sp.]|nr:LysR family transcriptional regulator [Accumulibacter sp.]